MLRNLFILGIAACLTGTSQGVREFAYKNAANEDFSAYDDNDESYRMQRASHGTVYKKDEAPAEANPQTAVDSDSTKPANVMKESVPPVKVTNATSTTTSTTTTTTTTTTTPRPLNGTTPKLTLKPLLQRRKVVSVHYLVYKKDDLFDVYDGMPELRPDKETYVMIHGFSNYSQDDYINDFYKSGSSALVNHCDCNVFGVKWEAANTQDPNPEVKLKAAMAVGRKLGKVINDMRSKGGSHKPITVISHDLGNLAAATLSLVVKKPVDYFFGLDQRQLHGNYRDFYLRQDAGKLVQTITTRAMQYNYGHRNFYPNGGNVTDKDHANCFLCYSYKFLFADITENGRGHYSTFCSSYRDYESNECEHFPTVSYFNTVPSDQLPLGNYFLTESILKW